jgi:hypothetical protein
LRIIHEPIAGLRSIPIILQISRTVDGNILIIKAEALMEDDARAFEFLIDPVIELDQTEFNIPVDYDLAVGIPSNLRLINDIEADMKN